MTIHHVCYGISEPTSVLFLFPLFVGLFLQSAEGKALMLELPFVCLCVCIVVSMS